MNPLGASEAGKPALSLSKGFVTSPQGCGRYVALLFLFLFLAQTSWAADKSGVSPNSISLPKGPGSIEGLGESFQPSLNTGTAKYGIGLTLPPGVAGHQPSLGLNYEGGGGNGPLGFGWDLSLPSIQRRTDKGVPTYGADMGFPRSDVFINESKEELVPQTNEFFFCKNESSFVRYRFVPSPTSPGQGHWEATAPDGTRLEFGLGAASRIEDTATARTFRWLLQRETDTRGNVIEYGYRSFPGPENFNQKYLATIRYGPGAQPWTHFHFVAFTYEDRLDWFEDGRAGFLVRTGKRLKSIFVGTQGAQLNGHLAGDFDGDGTPDFLSRRYDLGYLRYAGNASHWSLLETVTLVGADGVTALPPARHHYNVCDPPAALSAQNYVMGGLDEPPAVMDNELVDLLDLNADGLPDVFRTQSGGGVHRVWLNQGPKQQPGGSAIQWSAAVEVDPGNGTAWNFDLASDQTHLADMDGDGLADLVRKGTDDSVFYFANRGKLAWGQRQEMSVQDSAPPALFGRPDVRTADLDFDKRIDVIQSVPVGDGILYRIWFNLGDQTYSPAISVEPAVGFDFSLPGMQIADCNGDRVPDLARIQPGAVVATAGLGYGRFAEPKTIAFPDAILDDEQLRRAKLADINGDGLADLVLERAGPGMCWYWLNLGNYTFSPRKTIVDLPATVSPNTAVRWADLNGNGTTDLIYADSLGTPRLQTIEIGELLNGGLAPNTLLEINNGIGRVTQIEYAPSTRFALEDAAAGQPWPDPLPFPVTVVSTVTLSDSLGHQYVTRFRYHNGYYDAAEKQFRGFAQAERIDVGDPSAPTLVSRSHFDTGREFEAMKGRVLRASTETEDGRLFSEEITTWANPPRTLMVGTNGLAVRFAHPVATVKQILELGRGAPRRLESEVEFDDYGNQTRSANYGIVEGADRAAFDDERITLTEYALNLTKWILRLPKRRLVQDENGAVITRSESFYDDETFAGNNFGSVTIGNLTLRHDWIQPSNATAYVKSARTRYDGYGNPIAVFDPLSDGTGNANQGHFRELTYDDAFHSYPTRETIHVGNGSPALVFQAAYDAGLATMLSSTDFNGNTTTYGYDPLTRLTTVIKPLDTAAFPTAEYDYALALPVPLEEGAGAGPGLVNYVETRHLDRSPGTPGSKRDHYLISRQFSDGLGRPLMTRSEAEPASGQTTPRVVVSGAVLFNARQKPFQALNPFFTLQSGSLDELLAFENIDATDWRGQFHENGSLVSLDLGTAHRALSEYDATLRTVLMTNPDGTRARTEYEPLINRMFDENDADAASPHFNTPMVHSMDGLGRLIRMDEVVRLNDDGTPSGETHAWTTRYEYDLNDRLVRITDSQNNIKVMQYDGLKRKTFMNDPDAGRSTNRYDAASNLIETVDAKGQRITYSYDGANRILAEDYHDDNSPEFSYHRSPDVAFHYDTPAASVDQGDGTRATARNTKGTLAYVEDTTGEEHNSFDARGRTEWTVKRIVDPVLSPTLQPASSTLVAYKTAFEYDSLDRVTRTIYPDNDEVTYRYNARSLLEGISGGPSGSIVSGLGYLPSAQQERIGYGNGVQTSYAYDTRARLMRLNTLSPGRGSLIDFSYDLDPVSNIRGIDDRRPESLVPSGDARRNTQRFQYDNLYRLTRVQYNPSALNPQSTTNSISYRYDRIGNMLSQSSDIAHLEKGVSVTDVGAMAYGGTSGRSNRNGRQPNDPPGPHALSGISNPGSPLANRNYSYDANGNMTQIDGLRCTWDFLDRLVAVEDESMRAEYRYDSTGRRVIKRVTPRPPPAAVRPSASLYPGKYFEVRDHDQPTKYVFNGGTRVAHIIGSLSSNTRIQRIRLGTGWTLLSLAVTADDLARQLQQNVAGQPSGIGAIFRWNPASGDYSAVLLGQSVPAGAVLWVKSSTNAALAITGAYTEPANKLVPVGGNYFSGAGLEVLPLLGERAGVRADVALWHFDSFSQGWESRLPAIPVLDPGFPGFLSPGSAVFVQTETPRELTVPDAALRIRYYHQDHIGSSSVMTDDAGALFDETAFYPFGEARHEHRLRPIEESYKFTQKERDRESGLHYFEARYLAGGLSRFLSADPKYLNPEILSAGAPTDPQSLNLYAYVRNSPVKFIDPTGLDANDFYIYSLAACHTSPSKAVCQGMLAIGGGKKAESVEKWLVQGVAGAIGAVMGINTANAPTPADTKAGRVYDSLGYDDHAKNIVITVGGGKLINSGVRFVGKLTSQPSKAAVSTLEPPAPAPGSGSVGGKSLPSTRSYSASEASLANAAVADGAVATQQSYWMAIFQGQKDKILGPMERLGVVPTTETIRLANVAAFQEADRIFLARFGTPPPKPSP